MFSFAECALMADAVYHVVEDPHWSSITELRKLGCIVKPGDVFEQPGPLYRGAIWTQGNSKGVRGAWNCAVWAAMARTLARTS